MSLHRIRLAVPLIASGLALACGASKTTQEQQTTSPPTTGHGQLALSLVDAPARDVSEIWVKVTAVNVHHSGSGWVPVFPQALPAPQTLVIDLLKLRDSALDLGIVDLPPGTSTQVRLVIDPDPDPDPTPPNYNTVVLPDGTEVPLKVPSGAQSGIKIHGSWEVTECNRTTLTLDFDGPESIFYHPTGHEDLWILRPVIRVKNVETTAVGCEPEPTPSEPVACDPADPTACEGGVCLPSTDPDLSYCAQHPGPQDPCTTGAQCISGSCDLETSHCDYSDPGQPCYADVDCQSSSCDLETHACEQGGGGAPCDDPDDCQSGLCDSTTNLCTPVCTDVRLPGESCLTGDQCLSGECHLMEGGGACEWSYAETNGSCRPGESDCLTGTCVYTEGACLGTCTGT